MTDELNEKQKRVPYRNVWQGYVALGLAAVLCMVMAQITAIAQGMPIFYPLLVFTQYPPLQALLWGAAAILFVGLLIFATRRRLIVQAAFVFLISGFLLLYVFLYTVFLSYLIPYQTLSHQGYVYYLVSQWNHSFDFPSSDESYRVLKCDTSGVMWYGQDTPYSVMLTDYSGDVIGTFDTSGELFIYEFDQTLKLRVGNEVYSIDADQRRR